MEDYSAIVHATLNDEFTSNVVAADQEEQAKAQFTRLAAWNVHKVNPNIGLLQKDSGTQVGGLSVDVIVDKTNGDFSDIATAVGVGSPTVTIKSMWQPNNDPALTSRWVEPTLILANLPGPMPRTEPGEPPTEPPTNPPSTDIEKTLAIHTELLNDIKRQQATDTAAIIERDDYNTKQIMDQLAEIEDDFNKGLRVALLLLMRNRPAGATRQPVETIVTLEAEFTKMMADVAKLHPKSPKKK